MFKLTIFEKILFLTFLISLPLVNPWIRGDGVGYYAFARSLLIEHDLNFEKDWLAGNPSFRMGRIDAEGHVAASEYTSTGHLNNHFTIGPAILWAPFLIAAHVGVHAYDLIGGQVPADGYSTPYAVAMALGTAIYGFLALWISFRLTRKYIPEVWAFLATLGIWFAGSLLVYMYFNPSWSHAQSAFAVALFLWYWDRTRNERTTKQWVLLGLLGGLMMNVYYPNAVLLLIPLLESLAIYRQSFEVAELESIRDLFIKNLLFATVTMIGFLPTLIEKKIIYGSYLDFGYTERWFWNSPAILRVCFSSNHGLFSWTPIMVPAVAGLFILGRREPGLSRYLLASFATFLYVIGCYENWHGLSSFGNRFFISLTVLFVLGLAAFFDWLARSWNEHRAIIIASGATAVLVLWNFGLIFQWGTRLIPARGPISWREASYNQFAVVPVRAAHTLGIYLTRRKQLMGHIEEEDSKQLKTGQSSESEGNE